MEDGPYVEEVQKWPQEGGEVSSVSEMTRIGTRMKGREERFQVRWTVRYSNVETKK